MSAGIDWTIVPNQGVGRLRFGMTPAEALAAMPEIGEPERTLTEFDGTLIEDRGTTLPKLAFADGRLRDVDFNGPVEGVRFEDLDIFAAPSEIVMQRLFARNGGALAGLGSVLFLTLGINTGAFFELETYTFSPEPAAPGVYRTLAVFAPGAFDDLLGDFKPLRLPQSGLS